MSDSEWPELAECALLEAMAALERALTEVGRPHMLIGGLAVIARGVPRHTDDVDATDWAPDLSLATLVEALASEEIRGRIPDLEELRAAHRSCCSGTNRAPRRWS